MVFKNKNFLIAGVSLSGVSSASALLGRGANVYVYDDEKTANIDNLVKKGAINVSGYLLNDILKDTYCIIKSPGVPKEIELIERAASCNIPVISEIELGFYLYRGTVLAVTGTNGKSTTASLIDHILKAGGEKSFLCGNIGVPFTKFCDESPESFCVTEVSSFQLENCYDFKPHISAVLNITEDHLNRHHSMEDYISAKKRIIKNQRKTEYTVLNFDCAQTRSFFEDAKSNVIWFSGKQKVNGAYLEDGKLKYCGETIIHTGNIRLIGYHNHTNCLAAVCFAKLLGIGSDIIANALSSFTGISHRLQNAGTVNGRAFYNDSKATNVESVLTAVRAMKKGTVLILGGYDKNISFDRLFKELAANGSIERCVLCGQVKEKLRSSAEANGYKKYVMCDDFESGVYKAYEICKKGGTVLLSPACASFDEFKNFEERGEKFCAIVRKLENEG